MSQRFRGKTLVFPQMVFTCTAESKHQRLFVQIVAMFFSSSLNNLATEIKLEKKSVLNRNSKLYSYKLFTAVTLKAPDGKNWPQSALS